METGESVDMEDERSGHRCLATHKECVRIPSRSGVPTLPPTGGPVRRQKKIPAGRHQVGSPHDGTSLQENDDASGTVRRDDRPGRRQADRTMEGERQEGEVDDGIGRYPR